MTHPRPRTHPDSAGASVSVGSVPDVNRRPLLRAIAVVVLIGACVAIAVARVLPSSRWFLVMLAAAAPLAPILAGLAVLLAASVLVRRDLRGFRWAFGLSGALLMVHLWWFAPLVVGGQPPRPPAAFAVRVMTINTLGGRADAGTIVRAANAGRVDVLVVTEVTADGLRHLADAGVGKELPYRYGEAAPSPAGTMVFLRRRGDVVTPTATNLKGYVVQTTVGSHTIRLVAAHPTAPTDLGGWRNDMSVIGAAARTANADLVVGDLNATLDHKQLRDLMAQGRYRDSAELLNAGWQPTFPANGIRRRLGIPAPGLVQLDHVLIRDDGGADRIRTVDVPHTDHTGVIVDVWLPATERIPRDALR